MEKRNLDLAARNEDTRDKFHTKVIRFELDQILQHFTESIQVITAQFEVADELIKYGLCEIYDENWESTDKYENIQVSMKVIEVALKSGEEIDWFLENRHTAFSLLQ